MCPTGFAVSLNSDSPFVIDYIPLSMNNKKKPVRHRVPSRKISIFPKIGRITLIVNTMPGIRMGAPWGGNPVHFKHHFYW